MAVGAEDQSEKDRAELQALKDRVDNAQEVVTTDDPNDERGSWINVKKSGIYRLIEIKGGE